MIEITAEIRAFIDKAAVGVELAEDEYIDPSDGLIHCKKCGGQRQTVVPCFGKSGYFMPRCICQCQREAEEQRKAAEERQRRMERIKRRKAQGLQDRYLYDYTFSNDNGQNPLMDKAHAYGAWEKGVRESDATFPRLTTENNLNNYRSSSFWIKNGNFLRLSNVELGYQLPSSVLRKVNIKQLRLYVNGQNLLSIDKLGKYNLDPEVVDAGVTGYPMMRSFNIGINMKF